MQLYKSSCQDLCWIHMPIARTVGRRNVRAIRVLFSVILLREFLSQRLTRTRLSYFHASKSREVIPHVRLCDTREIFLWLSSKRAWVSTTFQSKMHSLPSTNVFQSKICIFSQAQKYFKARCISSQAQKYFKARCISSKAQKYFKARYAFPPKHKSISKQDMHFLPSTKVFQSKMHSLPSTKVFQSKMHFLPSTKVFQSKIGISSQAQKYFKARYISSQAQNYFKARCISSQAQKYIKARCISSQAQKYFKARCISSQAQKYFKARCKFFYFHLKTEYDKGTVWNVWSLIIKYVFKYIRPLNLRKYFLEVYITLFFPSSFLSIQDESIYVSIFCYYQIPSRCV